MKQSISGVKKVIYSKTGSTKKYVKSKGRMMGLTLYKKAKAAKVAKVAKAAKAAKAAKKVKASPKKNRVKRRTTRGGEGELDEDDNFPSLLGGGKRSRSVSRSRGGNHELDMEGGKLNKRTIRKTLRSRGGNHELDMEGGKGKKRTKSPTRRNRTR
tara:strand:- start:4160 stop:4627 length:468 start_codon:yes stop_codon:yes gene_type:complete